MSPVFENLLLCTDLDRTLLPNGPQAESENARELFRQLVELPSVSLVFVTGRDHRLVKHAMREYDLPNPDFVIGDVGSSLCETRGDDCSSVSGWDEHLAENWSNNLPEDIQAVLSDIDKIRLQEVEKQSRFKISYYVSLAIDHQHLIAEIEARFVDCGIPVNVIWSVDEAANTGLLDILPQRASKLHAIEYLMSYAGFSMADTVFAGDSGNDISVLCSAIPAVLVANASDYVRIEARALARLQQQSETLYVARGDFIGMNGNYSAGILEGIAQYKPEYGQWLEMQLTDE